MRIDIEKALRDGGIVEASMPIGSLEWERGLELATEPVHLKGRLSRLSRGYDFQAHLNGGLGLECVRCLSAFSLPLSFDFHLVFVKGEDKTGAGESQIQQTDCDLYPCVEGKVDLASVIREQMYLQIPLKPVCSDHCRGLCVTCGESLNLGPCRCAQPSDVRVVS